MGAPCPVTISAASDTVLIVLYADGRLHTATLVLPDAERAMGQMAVAVVEARRVRPTDRLDRR